MYDLKLTSEYDFLKRYNENGYSFINFNDFYKAYTHGSFLAFPDNMSEDEKLKFKNKLKDNALEIWNDFNKGLQNV